jgi:hypothetical protein
MIKLFLTELYNQTGGNTETQVSMYDVGKAVGLEKSDAGTTAEDIIIQGLAELKTLSGAIAITKQGLEELGVTETASAPGQPGFQLADSPFIDDFGKKELTNLLGEIKHVTEQAKMGYALLEEIVFEIKTLETQLLSPRPKTAIARAVLCSLQDLMEKSDQVELSDKLKTVGK